MALNYLKRAVNIGGRTAVNGFAALPTESNSAGPGGVPSAENTARYRKLAEGGWGLIYCEASAVSMNARARINQLVITPENWKAFSPMVKAVKETNPAALFIIQLDHAGALADPAFSVPAGIYAREGGEVPVLTDDEIGAVIKDFAGSAEAARMAGFDGVEIKLCHGFLGNEFIQPLNRRPGRYGGNFENRMRFLNEILEGLESSSGHDFIRGLRIPAYESIPGGFGTSGPKEVIEDLREPIELCRKAEKAGVSIISVSAGNAGGNLELINPSSAYPDGVYRHFGWASAVRRAVKIPVVGAGYSYLGGGDTGLGSFTYWAEKNLRDRNTGMAGLGRQAIADPMTPVKIFAGKENEVNYCTACLGCGILLGGQKPVKCVVYND